MIPDIANQAREILRQHNSFDFPDYKFRGPHYVEYIRGDFFLRPFGAYSEHRYSFHCVPSFTSGEAEPFWIFNVL